MLTENNEYVKAFRYAKERFEEEESEGVHLVLINNRAKMDEYLTSQHPQRLQH